MDGLLDRFDHFARQSAEVVAGGAVFALSRGGRGDGDVFDEDGDTLDGLVAEGPVVGGELEAVGDVVGEVARAERIFGGEAVRVGVVCGVGGEGFREELLLGGVDEEVGTSSARAEGDDAVGDAFPCVEAVFFAVELGLELFDELVRGEGLACSRELVVGLGRVVLRAILGSWLRGGRSFFAFLCGAAVRV